MGIIGWVSGLMISFILFGIFNGNIKLNNEVHVTKELTSSLTCYSGGSIIFSDNTKGKIRFHNGEYYYLKEKEKISVSIKADCLLTENME